MDFKEALQELCDLEAGSGLKALGSELDEEWVRDALEQTGTCTIRRRKLPAEQVVWLVIGMGLFRDRSIVSVVKHLGLARNDSDQKPGGVVGGAIPKARRRVGEAPLRALFESTGRHWGHQVAAESHWRGLSIYAIDGSHLSVPDTPENREAFSGPKKKGARTGYPKLRLVTLMSTRGHIVVDAAVGAYLGKGTGEMTLSKPLFEQLPDNSLLTMDRGFLEYHRLWRLQSSGEERHWLIRVRKLQKYEVTETLGNGDYLATVTVHPLTREKHPKLPEELKVRVIEYQVKGYPPQKLMTSLLDAERWPAEEVIQIYHERWEIELGFRELKTHMLERRESLRSKTPEGIRQELWGILIAYNLIRRRMVYAAKRINEAPNRMSFRFSMMLIQAFCVATAWVESPSSIPRLLAKLDDNLEQALLPARRSERRYPRTVKVEASPYKRYWHRPRKRQ